MAPADIGRHHIASRYSSVVSLDHPLSNISFVVAEPQSLDWFGGSVDTDLRAPI
jgi:hypothetical protein